jgi:hypothetical protein
MPSASTFPRGRQFLSETALPAILVKELGDCTRLSQPQSDVAALTLEDVAALVGEWQASIGREANRLIKRAYSNLADLPSGCIYRTTREPAWKKAATIVELFRNPGVSKNAGRLETQKLQEKLHACLGAGGDELRFSIGWGQPKRGAGGLKTLGPMADIAELYTIARLAILMEAVNTITGRTARMTVLTGGTRFYDALFTRPALTKEYDAQRTRIAEALCSGSCRIEFMQFREALEADHETPDVRRQRLALAVNAVDETMVHDKFHTVLMNLDWEGIFKPASAEEVIKPHGLDVPAKVDDWIGERGSERLHLLIRAVLICLINPNRQTEWIAILGDEDLLEEAMSFAQKVAWLSTRKYLALHALDADKELASSALGTADVIRLSVHEKMDRRDIPALLTLGPQGGNLLSQHVMAAVDARGKVGFATNIELQNAGARQVHIRNSDTKRTTGLFDWLCDAAQPVCFVDPNTQDVREALRRLSLE